MKPSETKSSTSRKATIAAGAGGACAFVPLDERIHQTSTVFVGLVISAHGYQATVRVEDIWVGNVPAKLHVSGGPNTPPGTAHREGWRKFSVGKRYLFLTDKFNGEIAQINECSGTRLFTKGMSKFEPPNAHHPR